MKYLGIRLALLALVLAANGLAQKVLAPAGTVEAASRAEHPKLPPRFEPNRGQAQP